MKLSLKQTLTILFLILTPLVVSMLPFAIQSAKTPNDRVFMGLHRWSEDYYGYLQLINQGQMGHLQTVSKLTSEPHISTFVHSEYAVLGLLARPFGLNAPLTYHLSRLILGAIFLIIAYYFFVLTLKSFSAVGFLLAFFIGGWPSLTWWGELDVTRRSTILPHYLMGSILFLIIFILIIKNINNKKLSPREALAKWGYLSLASLLLSFVHPVDFAVLMLTLGIYLIINFICFNSFIRLFVYSFIVFFSGLIPIIYFKYVFTLPFWRFVAEHGTATKYNIPLFDFVLALGPVFWLAILGILVSLRGVKRRSNLSVLMLSWLLAQSLFFLKLYEVVNFDRLRTMHAPYFIPLAFFAALFLKRFPKIIVIIIIIFITIITVPISIKSIQTQINEVSDFKSFSPFVFPTKKQYQSYEFLREYTPDNSFITAQYEAKFLIPSVTGNKIAFGGNFNKDPKYQENSDKINKIYQGQLSQKDTYNFLTNNSISYLYWGYQEKSYGGNLYSYPFLTPIFDNGEVTIFRVK